MKNIIILAISMLLVLNANAKPMFQPSEDIAAKGEITYCATIDNPPRAFADASGKIQGFEIDLGVEIANRLGL